LSRGFEASRFTSTAAGGLFTAHPHHRPDGLLVSSKSNGAGLSAEQLMEGLAGRPASEWAAAYQKSQFHKDFIQSRAGKVVSKQEAGVSKPKRSFGLGQMITLFQRNSLLKLRDRTQTLILLGQAPLFAILVGIVFNGLKDQQFTDPAKWAQFSGKLASAHFLTVVAAVWFGCNNAARDIVGETTIFLRERMVNLKLPSYVFSKVGTLGVICVFQCLTLLTLVYIICGLTGPFFTLLAILLAASLVGTSLGLLISALAPTTESAIAFLPVVLLPFILLGGGIKPVHEMPQVAQWIASVCPTRWAYEASLLQEAKERKSTFKNALEEQLIDCQKSVGQCEARAAVAAGRRPHAASAPPAVKVQTDVAAAAFPLSEGRSSLRRSFEILGITLSVCLILLLTTLSLKSPQAPSIFLRKPAPKTRIPE
jgi:ABC-2 family transporter